MSPIVAFVGRAGSGKSTLAAFLVTRGYTELSLADELKRLALDLFPRTLTQGVLQGPSAARSIPFTLDQRRIAAMEAGAAAMAIKHDPEISARVAKLFTGAPKATTNYERADHFTRVFTNVEKTLASSRTILQVLGTEWGRGLWDEVWLEHVRRTIADKEGRYVIPDARFANEVMFLKNRLGAKAYWLDAEERLGPNKDPHASEPSREALAGLCDGVIDTNSAPAAAQAQLLTYL